MVQNMEDTTEKTEFERFKEWTDAQGGAVASANVLGFGENYLYSLRSGVRPITDEVRAAWKKAGGDPDTPELVKAWME
jgi:hypothetical protein